MSLLSKRLYHGGNPVLRWMADNVAVKQDPAGNFKPDKSKSTERIDGMVALIMALGRAAATSLHCHPQFWVVDFSPGELP